MNVLNERLNPKISKIIAGMLCVLGIVLEILLLLSEFFADSNILIPFFHGLCRNIYIKSIVRDMLHLSLIGVVLAVSSIESKVHRRCQDLMLVKLIRIVGLEFFMYAMLYNIFDNLDFSDSKSYMFSFMYQFVQYALIGLEVYILIRLIILLKDRKRILFSIMLVAVFEKFLIKYIIRILVYNNIAMLYIDTIRLGIVAVTYIVCYILALSIITNKKEVHVKWSD